MKNLVMLRARLSATGHGFNHRFGLILVQVLVRTLLKFNPQMICFPILLRLEIESSTMPYCYASGVCRGLGRIERERVEWQQANREVGK